MRLLQIAAIVILGLLLVSTSVLGQPTRKDVLWEVIAGYGAGAVGSILGSLAGIPIIFQYAKKDSCGELSHSGSDETDPELTEHQACELAQFKNILNTNVTISSFAGSLGSLAGVVAASRAQGHEAGSLWGARGGALIGFLVNREITIQIANQAAEDTARGLTTDYPWYMYVVTLITPIAMIALIIIGYHLF